MPKNAKPAPPQQSSLAEMWKGKKRKEPPPPREEKEERVEAVCDNGPNSSSQ